MKVLLVSEPGVDGVFRFVESLAHFLADHGHEVHYAYSDRNSSDQLSMLVDFIHSRGGKTLNLAISNRPALSDFRAVRALLAFVRDIRPHVIHSHSSKAGMLARVLPLLGVHAPQVYQPHAYSGMLPQPGFSRIFHDAIERLLGRWSLTVNSSADEHDYALQRLRLPPVRTVTVTNGVDTGHFRPVSANEKIVLRRRLGLPAHGRILGTLGRAAPQKDPMTTYEAFAAALACDPDLYLLHVGRGELDRRLDRFIAHRWLVGRIIRLPYLSTPVDFYRAIDGFILTSLYEGMSLAVLEAMSCNLPLILSDAPGNRELLQLPLTHLWSAPIGNVSAFARAILAWSAKSQLSCNHRPCAVQHFDCRDTFTNMLSVYRRLQSVTWIDDAPISELTSDSSGQRRALG